MSLLRRCWQKLIIERELFPGRLCQVLVAENSGDCCRAVCEELRFICRESNYKGTVCTAITILISYPLGKVMWEALDSLCWPVSISVLKLTRITRLKMPCTGFGPENWIWKPMEFMQHQSCVAPGDKPGCAAACDLSWAQSGSTWGIVAKSTPPRGASNPLANWTGRNIPGYCC